ncbi:hypothetical protein NQ648_18305, partial [Acinetobacter baumannii]|nr:hypothetical protein [Acinetobacter baumannii]
GRERGECVYLEREGVRVFINEGGGGERRRKHTRERRKRGERREGAETEEERASLVKEGKLFFLGRERN